MADFRKLQIAPAKDTNPQETQALVQLAQVELETKRLAVQRQVTTAMLAVTCVFALFTVAIVVVLGVSLQQMRSALDEIAKNVGPDVVKQAVQAVQLSLNNTGGATGNMKELSTNIGEVGVKLVTASNASVALLATTNALATRMLEHPQFTLALGGG